MKRRFVIEVSAPAWTLQSATPTFQSITMTDAMAITLPALPPLLHFAKRQDVVMPARGAGRTVRNG